ncbi:sulfide/dihydroorotate dehydrogenase-like FAD/NAD-binding protein [Candidatus Bathyarchaeota archaeon]|nr:MAG: sulfide/dihydroorotate dehydrogenase-like FAD/NAD-binding protein [Candidatus Bathyarchaeota archaeon]
MYKIVTKKELAPKIKLFEVHAPEIAKKAKPGQFIILMVHEKGERIPLTISDLNLEKGTITFVFNEVGKTTFELGLLKEGDVLPHIAGPLGNPSEIKRFGKVLCVAGGVMIAPMLFQAKALREAGNHVTMVLGVRIAQLLFFEDRARKICNEVYIASDDGSIGYKGLDFLKTLLKKEKFDRCIAMGPVVMLKTVSEITKPFGIPTVVTVMPVMVDGMGMCGVCRVTVAGKTRFACVDGPEFDGHQVDYDELLKRQKMFVNEERFSSILWEMLGGGKLFG